MGLVSVKWCAHELQGGKEVLTVVFLGEERRRCVLSTCGVVGGTSAAWFFVDPVELSSGKVGEGSNGFAGGWRSRVHEESRIEDVVWANCSGGAWRQWLWR